MSKYINVDIGKFKIPKGTVTDVKLRGVPAIIELIEKQPIVDAVEVVRCKDCKHRSKLASEDSYGVEDWVCNHDCGCAQCNDDDFCRYGERKDYETET